MIVKDEKLLRQQSDAVESYEEGMKIADQLLKEVQLVGGHVKALGLAAPQIGIFKRVFITWGSTGESKTEGWNVYINPVLEELCGDEKMFYQEGCLSFPYATVRTRRHKQIIVSNVEEDGKRHRYCLYEQESIVFQHELDHLDGVLMFDRVANSVPADANSGKDKIGRNEQCPCGSGKKYKKCCGR